MRRLRARRGAARLLLCVLLSAAGWLAGPARQRAEQARGNDKPAAAPDPAEVALVREAAHPLTGDPRDYDPLLEMIGDARFVLLGEATHGTREFYRERARITRRLIEEKGFTAVVIEADWPHARRVHEYVRGAGADETAERALSGFARFPRWMWRNAEFRDFVEWLRAHNGSRPKGSAGVGLYGMDLYSVSESADEVVEYLEGVDPDAARRAKKRYGCLGGYRRRLDQYGYEVAVRTKRSCEKDAAAQLEEMERRLAAWRARPDRARDDELFSAYQNARVVRHGEAYYRLLYRQNFSTWNLRDKHMATTLQELSRYEREAGGGRAKLVVWAHNSHQGDARMTERGEAGELNVGQLMRQFHDGSAVLVGFTTYAGEVIAASEWGAGGRKVKVRPALPESYAALFHAAGVPNFLLLMRGGGPHAEALARPRPERGIGVVYAPRDERRRHYFESRLSKQFDAVIHWDVTAAVEPLK
ncbi:MAG TPA: erythromycin esterase family protein [Pyrinomonadaceae bacterium]|nr:erythromycin esterase family protein [Pyrinomonadaceae bacterium]